MFFLLKSKQMVWIYTNNTLIIGLVKEREWKTKSQSIKTRIRTHKINISFLLEIHILWYWRIMSKKYMVINHVSNFLNFEIYQTSSLNKPNHSCERFFWMWRRTPNLSLVMHDLLYSHVDDVKHLTFNTKHQEMITFNIESSI